MDETLDSEDVAMLIDALSENYLRPWAGGVSRLLQTKDTARASALVEKGFLEYIDNLNILDESCMKGYGLTDKGFSFIINLKRGEIEKWADKRQQAGTGGQVNG